MLILLACASSPAPDDAIPSKSDTADPVDSVETADTVDTVGTDTVDTAPIDADADGYPADTDCDDDNPAIHPDAADLCDGVDQDCDMEVDEDPIDPHTYAPDADLDGWAGDGAALSGCEAPEGYAEATGDCDDANAGIHPEAGEICFDGIDQNCDGLDDVACPIEGEVGVAGSIRLLGGAIENIGYHAESLGDLDGDGRAELAIAGSYANLGRASENAVYLVSPEFLGNVDLPTEAYAILTQDADATAINNGIHHQVVPLDDADGDGIPDFAVVVRAASVTTFWSGALAPGAYELLEDGAGSWTDPDTGTNRSGAAGDLDGDGLRELLYGSPASTGDGGTVYAGPWSDTALAVTDLGFTLTESATPGSQFGVALAAGDLDGDGYDDVLVGDPGAATVYAFAGPLAASTDTSGAVASWTGTPGEYTGGALGIGVIGGVPAVLVGASDAAPAGAGALYGAAFATGAQDLDAVATFVLTGMEGDSLGQSLPIEQGDVDGDGEDDLLVGAFTATDAARPGDMGCALLFYGPYDGEVTTDGADARIWADGSDYVSGLSVDDLDGDGHDDLLVGTPIDEAQNGSTWVILGYPR